MVSITEKKKKFFFIHRKLLAEKHISSIWMTYTNNGIGLAEVYQVRKYIREARITVPSMNNMLIGTYPIVKSNVPKFKV
ncbi:MAG: hypothetical protein EU535_07025 [Promethearchaeota archaeon]|nr:MAG: hypothetical protein EU535_07025 [Candidatus Lokiarchaeota archaeon]